MRFFFFDQKTEYECRISDWSSDVCSSDLDSGGAPVAISLDSVKIEDGTVIYRDATADIFEKVEDLDAEISAESLSGPFHARGEAVFQAVDRKSVGQGKSVSVRVDPGGRRIFKKKKSIIRLSKHPHL